MTSPNQPVAARPRWPAAAALAVWCITVPIGVTAVLIVDHILRRYPAGAPAVTHLEDVPFIVALCASATIGALVAWRRPEHPIGWLLLAFGFLVVESGFVEEYLSLHLLAGQRAPGSAVLASLDDKQFVMILGVLGLILLLTPTGRLPSRRWRPVLVGLLVLPPLGWIESILRPRFLSPPLVHVPNVLGWHPLAGAPGAAIAFITIGGTATLVLTAGLSLLLRFRRSRGTEREQLLWVSFGAAVTVGGIVMQGLIISLAEAPQTKALAGSLAAFFFAAVPVTTGVAVLQYRLYELGGVVRRTVTWLILTLAVVASYAVVVAVAGRTLGLAVAAAVALAAGALAQRLRDALDRRFGKGRHRAVRVVEAFVRRPASDLAAERVDSVLRGAVDDPTLRVAYWLPSRERWVDGEGREVDRPQPAGDRGLREVRRDGELVAVVSWAEDGDGPPAGLTDAIDIATGELEAARLRAEVAEQLVEVRASRARLVEAADQERRRIERDLHDGAQQRLVAIGLRLRAARLRAGAVNGDAAAVLDTAIGNALGDLGDAVKELRALANGVHPALLVEEGLRPALEAVADRLPLDISLDLTDGRFPPVVEATAYYVACEALANAAKHAGDCHLDLRTAVLDDHLVVEVADDGPGGASLARGTGLRGLADRVEAVGGVLEVCSNEGRGSMVRAELPCGS